MPRMPGLQLADRQVKNQLRPTERQGIAQALGENLAWMQELTWPIAGRYNAATNSIEPFERIHELPVESSPLAESPTPPRLSYSERVKENLRYCLARAQEYNASATPQKDIAWVEEFIADAEEALDDTFEPCFLMEDYKEGNLVVTQHDEKWQVSGVFDLMSAHFGDGEADLSRQIAEYLNEDPLLAGEFFKAYRQHKSLRPGFAKRFPVYMLLDRAILWQFFQRHGLRWWPEEWTFRDWASQYTSPPVIFDQL